MPVVLAIAVLGLAAGMLVNYLADVLPTARRLARPACARCGAAQEWASYLVWPRRCQACGRGPGRRTWVVEALFAALAVWLWLSPPLRLGFPAGLGLLVYFGVVVVIDVEHRLILHPVSLAGAAAGLGIGTWLNGLPRTLAGGLAGFGIMLCLYYLGILFLRILARRRGEVTEDEALGFGDVNLSGVLGLILGWPSILAGLVLTILLAGFFSLAYLLVMVAIRRYHMNMAFPYGPFLISSAVLLLYFSRFVAASLGW